MAVYNKIGENCVEAQDENGNITLYTKILKWNGVTVTDADADGENIIKVGYEYFKKSDVVEAVVPDPTFTDNTFDI